MAGRKCSSVAESEVVLGPELDTEPVATPELGSTPNSNANSKYKSSYDSIGELESTSEPASTAAPETRVAGCDNSSRAVNRGC